MVMKYKQALSALAGCTLGILLICAAGLGLTGCAGKTPPAAGAKVMESAVDLRETLKDTIKDPVRLEKMLALADQITADLQTGALEIDRLLKEQSRLNAEFATTAEELRLIGERIQSVRTGYRTKAISSRQALAQLATDKEWKKITSRDLAIPFK